MSEFVKSNENTRGEKAQETVDNLSKELDEINKKISNKIYGESPCWWDLDLLMNEYNKKSSVILKLDDIRHIAALYKNNYFTTASNSDLKIFPIPEIKQEIEKYKSFKKFIKKHQSSSKKPNPNNIINRLARNPIIQIMSIIVTVYAFIKIIETIFDPYIPYI